MEGMFSLNSPLNIQLCSVRWSCWESAKGHNAHLTNFRSFPALDNLCLPKSIVSRGFWYRVFPKQVVAIPTRHVQKYCYLIHRNMFFLTGKRCSY